MKTISIQQPWAQLICEGVKDIENRTWPTKFRGRVLIHVGVKIDENAIDSIGRINGEIARKTWFDVNDKKFSLGAIIGSVEIVGCVFNNSSTWAEKTQGVIDLYTKEFIPKINPKPVYNWVLANPILFEIPISAKGKLSFWDYPNILAESEEEGGELFCHCQLGVDEKSKL